MLYLLYKLAEFLALSLPVNIVYGLADFSGSIYYLLARRDRKIVNANIRVVLNHSANPKSVSCVSRRIFISFARYLVEFFRTPKIDRDYIQKHITFEGLEYLDQALKCGRGVLLLSAHLGSWELGAVALAMQGYKINILAYTHKNRLINEFFMQKRQSRGVKVIPLGAGLRKVFSALKRNELVAVLGDVDYVHPQIGIEVELFGQKTIMPKGPALFSLVAGSPIVPLAILREEKNKFRFNFKKAIIYNPGGNREEDLRHLTQKTAKVIEKYIAQYPEQWFMLTPRWPKKGAQTS